MINLKTPQEIAMMRRAGRLVASLLQALGAKAFPGVTTLELDQFSEEFLRQRGAIPAFKGYHGYPSTICTSINDEVVHGIPSLRKLKEGDLLSIDAGAILDGFFGDAAVSLPVHKVSVEAQRLMDVTREALMQGIAKAVPGGHLSDISHAVQTYVEDLGYSVVRDFVGHGIGRALHEDPQIPNFGAPGEGPRLKVGMVLAIEPMINQGEWQVKVKADQWTAVTKDGKLSAHFEHTIAIGEKGAEILTQV